MNHETRLSSIWCKKLTTAVMPTYHNAGGGYRNISAPARHTKVDNNQNNHHNTTNVVAAQTIIENAIQSLSLIEESMNSKTSLSTINLTTGTNNNNNNIMSHAISSPVMTATPTTTTTTTTHNNNIASQNLTGHMSPVTSPVIITPNAVTNSTNSKCLIESTNAKHEVRLNAMPWFHGKISRYTAEQLLQPREDGLFLVRHSTNFPGDYTLGVCFEGGLQHYRIKLINNKLTIDDEEHFENLALLVEHYMEDADGLCTRLKKPLYKQGKLDFCVDPKAFVEAGWVIQTHELKLLGSLGKGEFGDVMEGRYRGEKVAVKMLKDNSEAAQKFLAEASLMTSLIHENLVKLLGLVFNNQHMYLVTEYMSKGSLIEYLRSRGRQHVTGRDQIYYAYDTCAGMAYLESRHVVHRDLAARNVLVAEDNTAKVSDFGLARDENFSLDGGKLPIKWTAPEALKQNKFSNKSDMWSFGILLWEIYTYGRVPYSKIPLADIVKCVEKGLRLELPEGCPPEIYDIMKQAWDLQPEKRPSFCDVKVKLGLLKAEYTKYAN